MGEDSSYTNYAYPCCFDEVDGGFSAWSSWSTCSKTCLTGYKVRARYCNNPQPANGGKDCSELGPSRETLVCKPWPPCDGKHGICDAVLIRYNAPSMSIKTY